MWNAASGGSHVLTAEATDAAGNHATSSPVTVMVPSLPDRAVFVPPPDHDTTVTHYVLEIFTSGADPATATPVQTLDLGKPAIVNGECSADIGATIQSLPSGTYIATVSAVGSGGSSRSAPSGTFTR